MEWCAEKHMPYLSDKVEIRSGKPGTLRVSR